MRTIVAISTLAVSLAVAGAAVAQPAPPQRPGLVADADRDGRVNLAEFSRRAHERFARADLNRDGRLTREEARQAHVQGRAARVERWAGPDGALTRDEFRTRADERFARLDADRDGQVTPEEMRSQRRQRRLARMEAARPGVRLIRLGRMMGLDGEVTLAEIDAHLRMRFERRDLNNDGVLTPNERAGRRRMGDVRRRVG